MDDGELYNDQDVSKVILKYGGWGGLTWQAGNIPEEQEFHIGRLSMGSRMKRKKEQQRVERLLQMRCGSAYRKRHYIHGQFVFGEHSFHQELGWVP